MDNIEIAVKAYEVVEVIPCQCIGIYWMDGNTARAVEAWLPVTYLYHILITT